MNTPNKLTLARMIATPIFMATMLIEFDYHYLVSMVIFIAASLTDMIDGKMARKYNLVTDFGKFMDPLADKMLTTAAYLGFMFVYSATNPNNYGIQITIITFIVLFREFMVSSLRLVTAKAGLVSELGFIDMAQLKCICDIIIMVLFWISTVLCVISGLIYLKECKDYINPSK